MNVSVIMNVFQNINLLEICLQFFSNEMIWRLTVCRPMFMTVFKENFRSNRLKSDPTSSPYRGMTRNLNLSPPNDWFPNAVICGIPKCTSFRSFCHFSTGEVKKRDSISGTELAELKILFYFLIF